MAKKVTVFNLNTHPLDEMFKGEEVHIAPQDYWRDKKGKIKEVDHYEAIEFKGQYRPMPFDGSGKRVEDSKFFKMLRIEPVDQETHDTDDDVPSFKCMARECRFVGTTEKELSAHVQARHADAETLVLPDEDKAIRVRKKRAQTETQTEIQAS